MTLQHTTNAMIQAGRLPRSLSASALTLGLHQCLRYCDHLNYKCICVCSVEMQPANIICIEQHPSQANICQPGIALQGEQVPRCKGAVMALSFPFKGHDSASFQAQDENAVLEVKQVNMRFEVVAALISVDRQLVHRLLKAAALPSPNDNS